jgi:hypothetical protein
VIPRRWPSAAEVMPRVSRMARSQPTGGRGGRRWLAAPRRTAVVNDQALAHDWAVFKTNSAKDVPI